MVEIDWSQIERVAPSRIQERDILLVVSELKSRDGYHRGVWGDVTEIWRFPKDSQCKVNPREPLHDCEAYHFACDLYDEHGKQLASESFCFPTSFNLTPTKRGPVYVERSTAGK